jgi:hypothetical protein
MLSVLRAVGIWLLETLRTLLVAHVMAVNPARRRRRVAREWSRSFTHGASGWQRRRY